jgi:hypothetical protein
MNDKIQGVWIFDSKINNLYLNDTSGFFGHQYPIIYDFKENGELVLKNYGCKDTIFNWFIKSDSILTIDSLDYSIYSLNQDSISLIDYNRADTFWLTYKRPKEIKLDFNKSEIENILLSNIWSIDDTLNQDWATHFEYFDNKTMIYRYNIFDRNYNDSTDNLQLETWGIAEYKDYYFLYSYHDMMLGNGNFDRINQVIDINPNSYTILDSYGINKEVKFHSILKGSDNQNELNRLIGNWTSHNSESRTYGKYIPNQAIEHGRVALFEGDLQMLINEKTLTLKIDTLEPLVYNWQISKDGKTLVLEYHIDEPERKGIHVEYADILELTESKLTIRLFDNNYYTGLEKPNRYLLNMIQEFEKVE